MLIWTRLYQQNWNKIVITQRISSLKYDNAVCWWWHKSCRLHVFILNTHALLTRMPDSLNEKELALATRTRNALSYVNDSIFVQRVLLRSTSPILSKLLFNSWLQRTTNRPDVSLLVYFVRWFMNSDDYAIGPSCCMRERGRRLLTCNMLIKPVSIPKLFNARLSWQGSLPIG